VARSGNAAPAATNPPARPIDHELLEGYTTIDPDDAA